MRAAPESVGRLPRCVAVRAGQSPTRGDKRAQAGMGGRDGVGVGLVVDNDDGEGFAASPGDLVEAAVDVDGVDAAYLVDPSRSGVQVVVKHGPGQQPEIGRVVGDRVGELGQVDTAADGRGGGAGEGCCQVGQDAGHALGVCGVVVGGFRDGDEGSGAFACRAPRVLRPAGYRWSGGSDGGRASRSRVGGRSATGLGACGSATTPAPVVLARYIAVSASVSSHLGSVVPGAATATPMLAVMATRRPSATVNGAAAMARQAASAPARPASVSRRNSSPCSRAASRTGSVRARSRSATWHSTWSPAWWP